LVSPWDAKAVEARVSHFTAAGVPTDLAEDLGAFRLLASVPEIVLLANSQNVPAAAAAGSYFSIGGHVGLDRLRALAGRITTVDHWDRLALRRIVDDLYTAQRLLAADALKRDAGSIEGWGKRRGIEIQRVRTFLDELERGEPSIAKLALANSQIQKIAIS
jgi:glutamate dehydrogenase